MLYRIVTQDISVSRAHGRFQLKGDDVYVRDLKSKFGTSFLMQKAFPICMMNNARVNLDKYLMSFHTMSMDHLCPCFKLHNRILIDPIKIYTELMAIDPEPEPEPEPQPQIAIEPTPVQAPEAPNPGQDHMPGLISQTDSQVTPGLVASNPNGAPINTTTSQLLQGPDMDQLAEIQNKEEAHKKDPRETQRDQSQNAMVSSNNPTMAMDERQKEDGSEVGGLSFLDEEDEDDSMFSLSGASSFDMSDSDAPRPENATKFRF